VTLVNGRELDVFLELPEELGGSITRSTSDVSYPLPTQLAGSLPLLGWFLLLMLLPDGRWCGYATPRISPGMAIQGELQLRTNSPSFVVPRDALTRRGEQWLIYSVVEGKAKQFEVELIADMGEKMAISNEQLK